MFTGQFRLLLLLGLSCLLANTAFAKVYLMNIDGPIGPATAEYLIQGVTKAQTDGKLLLITLDTPGGLSDSTRKIVKSLLKSNIPSLVFVTPKGARAASAGTFLLYAATLAAMSEGTHLGAASPVNLAQGGKGKNKKSTMDKKVSNDAEAYIRSLAQLNKRNEKFAVLAVSKAATLTANEALKKGVINLTANNVTDLLIKLNHYPFHFKGKRITLNTTGWPVEKIEASWRTQLLSVITSPTIAYLLLLLGVYGIFFELANPGAMVPGVVGAIAILVALYALQMLPINYAGLGLILLGLAFMTAEAFAPSFGMLGIGGAIAFIIGSILLIDVTEPSFQIAKSAIAFVAIVNVLFLITLFRLFNRSHHQSPENAHEHLIDKLGIVLNTLPGQAKIDGEIWSISSDSPLTKGMTVKVIGIHGLQLKVSPIEPAADLTESQS